jgi:hypothetical protein
MAKIPVPQWAKSLTCKCGKQAKYKCLVSLYPLGVGKNRFTKSGDVIPICETCIQPVAKRVNSRVAESLASEFATSSRRTLDRMSQLKGAS